MGIIRGKIEAPREIRPHRIVMGESVAYEFEGKWYDKETHEELLVTTLEDELKLVEAENLMKRKNALREKIIE